MSKMHIQPTQDGGIEGMNLTMRRGAHFRRFASHEQVCSLGLEVFYEATVN